MKVKTWRARLAVVVGAAVVVAAGCGSGAAHHTATGAVDPTTSTPVGAPLQPPPATVAQDSEYLSEVAEADGTLATYSESYGELAGRALLTDGSAFCAFLERGGGVDQALVSLAVGANSVEKQTHLPLGVTTFNTIEAVALLALCPGEQVLLPAADRSRITELGQELGSDQG